MWIECSLVSFVILSALLLGVSVEASAKVRKPAVAGQFYPADPTTLRRMVEEMLEDARKVPVEGEIVGLVCPHAGYPYSGPTAAVAYKEFVWVKILTLSAPSSLAAISIAAIGPPPQAWYSPLRSPWTNPSGSNLRIALSVLSSVLLHSS